MTMVDQEPYSLTISWWEIPCGSRNGDMIYEYSLKDKNNVIIQEASTKSNTVNLDEDIKPCNEYTFEVNGKNENLEKGPKTSEHIQSGTEPPGDPENIKVTPGKDTVEVEWEAPTSNDCTVDNYTVTLTSSGGGKISKTVSGSVTSTTFKSDDGIKPNTEYTVEVVASNSAGSGNNSPEKETIKTDPRAGLIAGLTIPFGILLFVLIVFLVVLKKRQSKDNDQGVGGIENPNPSHPMDHIIPGHVSPRPTPKSTSYQYVRLRDLQNYVRKRQGHETETFKKEFSDIGCSMLHPCIEAKKSINRIKNRYANILTYDHSRVVLKETDDDESDYINASYIKFNGNSKAYIASQGPNEASLNDIWRMVWKENSSIIIMVTNLVEKNKIKCKQYWPDVGEAVAYGRLTVTNVDEKITSYFTIRKFEIKMEGHSETRSVLQYHFTAWPDMDVPASPAPLLEFVYQIKEVKRSLPADTGPAIVHCSAGVGRTGTVITIDAMLDMAEEKDKIDVYNFVKEMRENRFNMVQTQGQYMFIYETLLQSLFCESTHITTEAFTASFRKLKETNSRHGTKFIHEQYNVLMALLPLPLSDKTRAGKDPANVDKNRYPSIIPIDRARPFLMTKDGDRNNYINASFCKGYGQREDKYVVTQAPMPNTVSDFWRLIYDYSLYIIVMLNDENAKDESIGTYIPLELNVQTKMGPFLVELAAIEDYGCAIKRTLQLSKENENPREIHQFQYRDWPNGSAKPASADSFFQLRSEVDKSKRATQQNIVAVHCLDGRSRCGYFCAVDSIIQMINEEAIVDVFQNVKRIKSTCPSLIKTKEQYTLCYETAQCYLDSFDIYGNFK
ncbi:receptor-type tyrosine-protein phosphatase epsilon-like [Antedon mediterranea]|uniref:receptor-type tyrosine-protein phosphatase epsilon-like n=1 Tax=Antedon mediterranea TaxID=105859 RepID=UPI003AF4F2BE